MRFATDTETLIQDLKEVVVIDSVERSTELKENESGNFTVVNCANNIVMNDDDCCFG